MIKKLINIGYRYLRLSLYTQQERIKERGGKVGNAVFIGKEVLIDYDFAFLLEIGDGAVISDRSIIELHDSCLPNVLGQGKNKIGRVKIGRRAYIGVNSVVLPGVEIGDGAIIGACSLVNRSIPSRQVWAGVPASYICMVEELVEKRELTSAPGVQHFDWIGEVEKQNIDYKEFREDFINKVRQAFTNSENAQTG